MKAEILVVDDEPDIRDLLEDILIDEGYRVTTAQDGASARAAFLNSSFDLVLLDIWMPDVDGISIMKELLNKPSPKTAKIVMMSGHGTIETAVESTKVGAFDFLEKPLSTAKLLATVKNALKGLPPVNIKSAAKAYEQIIGKSTAIETLKAKAIEFAAGRQPVLIRGEVGAGKSVFARFIHQKSFAPQAGFNIMHGVAVTPGNIRENLSGEGTFYIKNIETISLKSQAVLTKKLDNGIRARLIASTSVEPAELEDRVKFLPDLYYRLSSMVLFVPPLRQHTEDIPDLLDHFINMIYLEYSYNYRRFSLAAQNFLRNYKWPGNIIELKNMVQKILYAGKEGEVSLAEVENALRAEKIHNETGIDREDLYALSLKEARDKFETGYLLYHLNRNNGNITQTAAKTGLERANLYRKLKVLGINPKNIK